MIFRKWSQFGNVGYAFDPLGLYGTIITIFQGFHPQAVFAAIGYTSSLCFLPLFPHPVLLYICDLP